MENVNNLLGLHQEASNISSRLRSALGNCARIATLSGVLSSRNQGQLGNLPEADWQQAQRTLGQLRKTGEDLAAVKDLIHDAASNLEGVFRPNTDPATRQLRQATAVNWKQTYERVAQKLAA